ncbi:MAG: DRTGG domain-containing protein [Oscillospiraceae bacterium]|nr:DRTGG domain-containing protein [Oscillospiraceae bacterium]
MTVSEAAQTLSLKSLCVPCPAREISGAYAGDLLSWVMGRARENNVWVTIMTNQSILAVATLIDLSCVIICDGSEIGDDVLALARDKQVNLLWTEKSSYDVCGALSRLGI